MSNTQALEQGAAGDARRQSKVDSSNGQGQLSQDFRTEMAKPPGAAPFQKLAASWFAPFLHWLVIFWLGGMLILSTRLFQGWMMAQRLKRRGISLMTKAYRESFARLARSIGVSRPVRLYRSVLVEVPTVIGWLRPVILVPASALTGLSTQQLEALLAHELAHIRRYDYFVNLLQVFVETLLFYHPAVWWVSRRIRIEREHACDDLAVAACGDALLYARALAELEGLRLSAARPLALAATGGSLVGRIRRIVVKPTASRRQRFYAWPSAVMLVATFLCGLMIAQTALVSKSSSAAMNTLTPPARREVAITFVGLPYFHGGYETVESLYDTTTKLLKGLAAHNIKAVGFVGEGMLNKEGQREARIDILRRWLDAGHELGNQSYAHLKLYDTPLADYKANVIRGEQVTSALMEERGKRLRYFSYPYLNTGPNLETKKAFEQFLAERGYTIHQVTIDNWDWYFSNAYQEAKRRGDAETMRRVVEEYLPYMEQTFAYYEQLSIETEGREIPQVLLLSASALNADNFDRLIEMIKRRGYSFVTMEHAQKDKAYAQPDTTTGPWGISWLQRWAMAKGRKSFPGEPPLPPYLKQFNKDGLLISDKKQE